MTTPQTLMKRMPEKEMQEQVIEAATVGGWLVYYTRDSRRCPPGYPDLTLVRERVMFVELKTSVGEIRPAQQHWHDRLVAAGADARIVRPDGLQALIAELLQPAKQP